MAKINKKPSKKRKFSLYLEESVMTKVQKEADEIERSVNYVVNKSLKEKYI